MYNNNVDLTLFFCVHSDKIRSAERPQELAKDIIHRGIFLKPLFWVRVLKNIYLK